MTAENMAKYRLDPNIDFWKEIKVGADHFEVSKTEPSVLVCGQHYEFDATPKGAVSADAPCPALQRDELIEAAVAEKEDKEDAMVAEFVAPASSPSARSMPTVGRTRFSPATRMSATLRRSSLERRRSCSPACGDASGIGGSSPA